MSVPIPDDHVATPHEPPGGLAVAICTCNNMRTIRETLASVRDIADRIVVVDSGSTDGTIDAVRSAGGEVVSRAWQGPVLSKSFAIDECRRTHGWVLLLDSDESLDETLREAIARTVAEPEPRRAAWAFNRRTWFLDGWLNHVFQPEWRVRLIRHDVGRVVGIGPEGRGGHDRIDVDGRAGRLPGTCTHRPWADVRDMFRRYADLADRAARCYERGGGTIDVLARPLLAVLKQLVLRGGVLDGRRGLVAALGLGAGTLMKHLAIAARRARLAYLDADIYGTADPARRPLVVWQLVDGKAGHMTQIRGLTGALARLVRAEVHTIRSPGQLRALWQLALRRFPAGATLPDPDVIVAAGRATHLALLAARRARGGRTVVLMSPQLPNAWFDLCIVPAHDAVAPRSNVVATRGVLNPMRPAGAPAGDRGLVLVGGPSSHFGWSDDDLVAQVAEIAARRSDVHWTLSTSRRTPPGLLARLRGLDAPNLRCVGVEQTDSTWVARQLDTCSLVWVTRDSVSMIYEALTAGARVGLLDVPARRGPLARRLGRARVVAGVRTLLEEGWVTPHARWRETGRLAAPPRRLREAERCAEIVAERLLGVAPDAPAARAPGDPGAVAPVSS